MNALKLALIRLAERCFRAFPVRWRAWVMRVWFADARAKAPENALRELIPVYDDVYKQIDRAAIDLDGGVHAKHRLMKYHDFFVERLRAGERVLDIGCGVGAVAFSMASRAGAAVTAVDFSEPSIRTARERHAHPSITWICGDAVLAPPPGEYETIVISNVLEHIERRVEFLRDIQARYRPRRWLVRVPMINRHWLVYLRRELGLPYFGDPTHFTEYTEESFAREMAEAGLRAREVRVNWGEIWAEVEEAK